MGYKIAHAFFFGVPSVHSRKKKIEPPNLFTHATWPIADGVALAIMYL
jgi:hypothetical protein